MRRYPVNKIIRFSSVDGPGNRTVLFLQGCNFDCKYCHNPETRKLCIGCGLCVSKCPAGALRASEQPYGDGVDENTKKLDWLLELQESGQEYVEGAKKILFSPEKCVSCDTCINICPHDASPRIQPMTALEAFEEVKKQMPYIRGVTVSGGECTLYPRFVRVLFAICKRHSLSTFIDSNGTYDFEADSALLDKTDAVMLDIKAFSEKDHLAVTACDNKKVLENAVFLAEMGKLYEVRTVVAPTLFDAEQTILETGRFLLPYAQSVRYKIIAYRPMGVREAYRHYPVPEQALLERYAESLRAMGWRDVVVI